MNRDVDADTAERRHRVRRIADREIAWLVPLSQSIRTDGQELHLIPVANVVNTIGELGRDGGDIRPELLDRSRPHVACRAFRDDVRDLPVVAPIEHHEHPAGPESSGNCAPFVRALRHAEPQHIDRRGGLDPRQPGGRARD